ncbi:MAG: hypothetical protein ACRECH_14815, partial [Nitrososphaerales archaeon]
PASLARRAKNLIASSKSKHSTKIGIVSVRSECTNQPALDSFGAQNEREIQLPEIEISNFASEISERPDVCIATSLSGGGRVRAIYGSDYYFDKYVRPYM